VGRQQGVSERKLMALADFESSSEFSDVERIVLRYAVALTQTPVEVSDDLFDQLKRQFNERQLVEFYLSHRLGEYRARFNHAFGIEAEGFSEGAFCALPARKA